MENLPEMLLIEIISRITKISDKNSLSLVSKHLYKTEADQRDSIRVGCALNPVNQALTSLLLRFPNLSKIEITYSGWISRFGKQLDDQGLHILSSHCPSLETLTLSFCSFITDSGLGYLPLCKKLRTITLNFAPGISSNGILSIVVGCKNLSALHLIHCMKVSSVEWLEYIGKMGSLEELSIANCRAIAEENLVKLGPGWNRLKRLEFKWDPHYVPKAYEQSLEKSWVSDQICGDSLKELILVNCAINPGRGISILLGKCKSLERIKLDTCTGLQDRTIYSLSQKLRGLKSISLRLLNSSFFTDTGLKALASGCPLLDSVELAFLDSEFQTINITISGILDLVHTCPIRVLVLNSVCFLDDSGLESLCSAPFLETLEIEKCQGVSDVGLRFVARLPCLVNLTICRCFNLTDVGLRSIFKLNKLECLTVRDCPRISEMGVRGTARSVTYVQDLSWIF